MTGSDELFGRRIAALLDQAAGDIPPGVAYRLQQARARALDGSRVAAPAPQAIHALAGGVARLPGVGGGFARGHWRLWVGVALIVAAAFGWQQWRAYRDLQVYEDLDAQILSSDLPIDAYLDRGFQAWLAATPPAN
ncbi:MAG TPA: DUF3619 family protein [Casimicrobiaceae bacterium]|jgi:hypothetical protein|nr:DUF3619 family protein [Casimicrobiaceae bacterium]